MRRMGRCLNLKYNVTDKRIDSIPNNVIEVADFALFKSMLHRKRYISHPRTASNIPFSLRIKPSQTSQFTPLYNTYPPNPLFRSYYLSCSYRSTYKNGWFRTISFKRS